MKTCAGGHWPPAFLCLFEKWNRPKPSPEAPSNACHCEPVVLRAANQNLNDCRWQSYLNVAQAGVAIPLKCPRTLERVPCLSLWERCPAGAERAFYPLSRLRRQLPQRGSQGGTDCDRREFLERATPASARIARRGTRQLQFKLFIISEYAKIGVAFWEIW